MFRLCVFCGNNKNNLQLHQYNAIQIKYVWIDRALWFECLVYTCITLRLQQARKKKIYTKYSTNTCTRFHKNKQWLVNWTSMFNTKCVTSLGSFRQVNITSCFLCRKFSLFKKKNKLLYKQYAILAKNHVDICLGSFKSHMESTVQSISSSRIIFLVAFVLMWSFC